MKFTIEGLNQVNFDKHTHKSDIISYGNYDSNREYIDTNIDIISDNFKAKQFDTLERLNYPEVTGSWQDLGMVFACVDERTETSNYQASHSIPGGGAEWDIQDLYNRISLLSRISQNSGTSINKVTLLAHEGCGWGAHQASDLHLNNEDLSKFVEQSVKNRAEILNYWLSESGIDVTVQYGFDDFGGNDKYFTPTYDKDNFIVHDKKGNIVWEEKNITFEEYNLNHEHGHHFANKLVINATSGQGQLVGAHGLLGSGPENASFGYNYVPSQRDVAARHPSVVGLITNIMFGGHTHEEARDSHKTIYIMIDEYTSNRVIYQLNNSEVDISTPFGHFQGTLPQIASEIDMSIVLFNPKERNRTV